MFFLVVAKHIKDVSLMASTDDCGVNSVRGLHYQTNFKLSCGSSEIKLGPLSWIMGD